MREKKKVKLAFSVGRDPKLKRGVTTIYEGKKKKSKMS